MPFVGRDAEISALAASLRDGERLISGVLILHGPAGVGKTALAAAVTKRLGVGRVHWAVPAARHETVLLRLLAAHGAPRREIVAAELKGNEEFLAVLKSQCERYIRGSIVVIDHLESGSGAPAHDWVNLLDNGHNLVIVTSRSVPPRWESRARLHAVRPLGAPDAERLIEAVVAERTDATPVHGPQVAQLAEAAQGLPAVLRVAGGLLARFPDGAFQEISTPDALVSRALPGGYTADSHRTVLNKLAFRMIDGPVTSRTIDALLPQSPVTAQLALRVLAESELVQKTTDGAFVLPSQIAAIVRSRTSEVDGGFLTRETATALVQAAVAGTHDELTKSVDEFIELAHAVRRVTPERSELLESLTSLLTTYGDAHRLVDIHRQSGGRWHLSEIARDLGLPRESLALASTGPSASSGVPAAWSRYSLGALSDAAREVDPALPLYGTEDSVNAVLGAVLCDQGYPLKAVPYLRAAHDAQRYAASPRDRSRTLLHHARACLRLGEPDEAEHLLGQAAQGFGRVGDARGENWVATERIRLLLLRGETDDALDTAQRALTAHQEAEDIRGLGWTCHHLALVHARTGHEEDARVALQSAADHFRDCADELGEAWTRHGLAVLSPRDAGRWAELIDVANTFHTLGCPHGEAWSLLEAALRVPGAKAFVDTVRRAEDIFLHTLGDESGPLWAKLLRSERGAPNTPVLALDYMPGLHVWPYLRECLVEFADSARAGRPVIPLRARDIIALPDPRRTGEDRVLLSTPPAPSRPFPHCQVRITLLDDSPTTILLLRVTPTEGHPWSDAGDARPPG
ncbi:AAA family ATPase [Streptomyces sp. NPDC002156]